MKLSDFKIKYPALDAIEFRIESELFRRSAEELTITRSSDRMPTAPFNGNAPRRGLPTGAYSNALKYVLETTALKRPQFNESLSAVVNDFDDMMREEYGCQKFGGLSERDVRNAMADAVKKMPENSVEYSIGLLKEKASFDDVSIASAARDTIEENGGNLAGNVKVLKALESVHAKHSLGWKIFHPFKNLREWMAIRSIKSELRESAGGDKFDMEYAKEPEKYNFKQIDGQEMENFQSAAQAQREEIQPERRNVVVPEEVINAEHVSEVSQPVEHMEVPNNNLNR
ncbi:MAG: hypothetical protein ACI4L9_06365 [Candidatus Coproplasma sp.]